MNKLNNPDLTPKEPQEQDAIDVQELLYAFLRNWYWILLCMVLGFLGARLYLRYTVPIYQASGKILIKSEESSSGALSEEAVLQEIGILKPNSNLQNEIQILKSRTLMREVMEQLGIDVSYIGQGRLRDSELYLDSPVRVDSVRWGSEKQKAELEIQVKDAQRFVLLDEENEKQTTYAFSAPIVLDQDTFWLSHHAGGNPAENLLVKIGQGPGKYLRDLQIKTVTDYSSVLGLQLEDPVPQKAADILNTLIDVYNQAAIDDKNQVAKKTLAFIDERLRLLTQELSTVEGGLETYKERNDIPAETAAAVDFVMTEIAEYDNQLTQQQLKLELLKAVEELLSGDVEQYELIPANIVLEDAGGLDAQIQNYNTTLLRRERLKQSATKINPTLVALNQQLAGMRQNIVKSVQALRSNLELSVRETERKLAQLQTRINQVPRQERELLEIKRQQNIKQALYLFLLQKKEETALSAAITVPNARVIDPAIPGGGPISPNPMRAYALGLMLGLALPIGTIFLRELLDNKVYSEADIKNLTNTPVLGAVAQNKSGQQIVVKANSRTGIAEMFRLLRTNLNYLSGGQDKQSILVTSGMGGDGKTFIAANLGISLALADKRVVILGMDLRKPKLAQYLVQRSDYSGTGLTNYLVEDLPEEDIIYDSEIHDRLYFVPSGPIPPNPAELLSSNKLKKLFAHLRQNFDYIVIDTAPVGLVADAFLLSPYTDTTLFAVRYGKTPQAVISGLEEMRRDKKLKNPAIVLNGVKAGKGYGYGYGLWLWLWLWVL